jgi:hypothetical protein
MFTHVSGFTLLILAVLYFIPAIVAFRRQHPNATPIMVLNICLGWTILGWVAALVWSLMNPAPKPAGYVVVQGAPVQNGGDKNA